MWVHPFRTSSDTLPQLYQNTLLWCHRRNKIKSSEICQLRFHNIFCIGIVQKNMKGYKMNWLLDKVYHIIIQAEIITSNSSIFNVSLFILTKKLLFCLCKRTYYSLYFEFFCLLFFFSLTVLMIQHPLFTSYAVSTSIFPFLNLLIISVLSSIFSSSL